MKAPNKQCTLDGLPIELKIAILSEIDHYTTLFQLIRASPAYYAAFKAAQREIMTSVALKERQDVLAPVWLAEIKLYGERDCGPRLSRARAAIEKARKQRREGRKIVLEVEQCEALLAIADYVPWPNLKIPSQRWPCLIAYCERHGFDMVDYSPVWFSIDKELADKRFREWMEELRLI